MATYRESILINAPLETVFSVVADIQRMTEIDKGVQKVEILSQIKEGLGVRSRWTQMFDGKLIEWIEEIIEWDPPHRYSFAILSENRKTEGTHLIESTGDGSSTKLTFIETYHYQRSPESAHENMTHLIGRVKKISESYNQK